jgi:aspartate kinase
MQSTQIYKFGGASVKDAAAIRNVAQILKQATHRPLAVVISAMGKMTNHLEAIVSAHFNQREDLHELVHQFRQYHESAAHELLGADDDGLLDDLNDLWEELNWILEDDPHPDYHYHYDQIIVFGELASTKIISAWIQREGIDNTWVDARSIIRTDNSYREARVLWDEVERAAASMLHPVLASGGLVITQGFIGSTLNNESTTLGREGSDYTAAILANILDAASVTIWKDVPGIMSADPKRFEDATLISELSYHEALEMTYYGAKVIHPRTIKPLQNKSIPLYVRPFDHPEREGTCISARQQASLPPIVVAEPGQSLLRIAAKDYSFIAEEHLEEIFNHIARLRIKVNTMRNSALSFTMCVRYEEDKRNQLIEVLSARFDISAMDGLELITIRHADQPTLEKLSAGKEIVLEEIFEGTHQLIVRN